MADRGGTPVGTPDARRSDRGKRRRTLRRPAARVRPGVRRLPVRRGVGHRRVLHRVRARRFVAGRAEDLRDRRPVARGQEARALRFLTDHGIDLSPRVLAFSRSAGALAGRPCVISSLCPGRTLAAADDELTCAQRHEVYRRLGQVLGRLHAVPAHGYGYLHGESRDPLLDNSAHMARMVERYLREFREHTADPALADRIAAHVAAHASAFAACPRPWSPTWFLDSPAHRRPRSRTQPGGPRRTPLGVPLS
ncbi:phosphotransferase family protein [Streptomyces spiralis]|uniref:phosphotransferase family protein n=1 Tax=Streptomyces spiralis TaxID=66376 RepID=UPI0033C04B4F